MRLSRELGRTMSVTDAAVQEAGPRQRTERIVNDFAIQVATVNGSGSQTANLVLLRSIFQMGVPVRGKNMFPSNIAGLPTWYTIRASAKGYIGRKKEVDFLVAMNAGNGQGRRHDARRRARPSSTTSHSS